MKKNTASLKPLPRFGDPAALIQPRSEQLIPSRIRFCFGQALQYHFGIMSFFVEPEKAIKKYHRALELLIPDPINPKDAALPRLWDRYHLAALCGGLSLLAEWRPIDFRFFMAHWNWRRISIPPDLFSQDIGKDDCLLALAIGMAGAGEEKIEKFWEIWEELSQPQISLPKIRKDFQQIGFSSDPYGDLRTSPVELLHKALNRAAVRGR